MKNLLKEKKAITLIALVITIVVLIILAGVLINISLGNNGLFNKAKTAKEMYTNAQNYEQTEIAKTVNEIDNYIKGARIGISQKDVLFNTETNATGSYTLNGNVNDYDVLLVIGQCGDYGRDLIFKEEFSIPNSSSRIGIHDGSDKCMNISFSNSTMTIHAVWNYSIKTIIRINFLKYIFVEKLYEIY